MKWCCITSPAVLVLLWDYLMYVNCFFLGRSVGDLTVGIVAEGWYEYGFSILITLGYLFFPLSAGLLADVWIGRYKAIHIGAILCFLSWIIVAMSSITESYCKSLRILWIAYGIAFLLQSAGVSSFVGNIIQYNIDQIVGASAYQLTTVIYWHAAREAVVIIIFT